MVVYTQEHMLLVEVVLICKKGETSDAKLPFMGLHPPNSAVDPIYLIQSDLAS